MGQLVKKMDVIEGQLYWCDSTKLSFLSVFLQLPHEFGLPKRRYLFYTVPSIGDLGVGRPPKKVKKDFLEINLTRVSAGLDGSKVDRNGRRSGRHPQGFAEMTPYCFYTIFLIYALFYCTASDDEGLCDAIICHSSYSYCKKSYNYECILLRSIIDCSL